MSAPRERPISAWLEIVDSLTRERDSLAADLRRSVFIAEHLFQMIPREVWRDSGGDDGQGHYEGDYRAEQTRVELDELSARSK